MTTTTHQLQMMILGLGTDNKPVQLGVSATDIDMGEKGERLNECLNRNQTSVDACFADLLKNALNNPALNRHGPVKQVYSTLLEIHNRINEHDVRLVSLTRVDGEKPKEHYLILHMSEEV